MLQVPLIKDLVCYICGKGVTDKDSVRIGGGLRRHRKCKPAAKRKKDRPPNTRLRSPKHEVAGEGGEDTLFP